MVATKSGDLFEKVSNLLKELRQVSPTEDERDLDDLERLALAEIHDAVVYVWDNYLDRQITLHLTTSEELIAVAAAGLPATEIEVVQERVRRRLTYQKLLSGETKSKLPN